MDQEGQEVAAAAQGSTQPAMWNAAIQAQNVTISGGVFSAGGSHTHYHEAPKPEKSEKSEIDLLSALKSIDNFRQIQQETLSKATPETGKWMFEYKMFPVWRDPKSDVKTMWGTGIPGAGKTVLTSITIKGVGDKWEEEQEQKQRKEEQKAQKKPRRREEQKEQKPLCICVCYIYIRYSDNSGLTIRHCLEVLVKQTIEKHPSCLELAKRVYTEHIRLNTRPTEEELLHLLNSFTSVVAATFYFLDALDEAPPGIQFDLLNRLLSLNVKLFITSRPLKLLQAEFPDAHCFTIAARDHDLDLHIDKEIKRSPLLRRILDNSDPSWQVFVISTVKEKCGGMFLHASLQMAALQECSSLHSVKETLEQFPYHIEDVYLQTWKRIIDKPSKNGLLAQTCIKWVLHATRSLTVEELQHAIATDPITHVFDHMRLVDKDALVAFCRGLLVIDEETKFVRLVRELKFTPGPCAQIDH
ncbi:hypothetical protein BKA70DRAFT_1488958 [Coprinopsis sp. MPI-PUGE-AT-0042]|nr:hypothetical protein BKA70DRAFT_1488958 [Coprinopsis sp. MPI-PUGE-AT-0042]